MVAQDFADLKLLLFFIVIFIIYFLFLLKREIVGGGILNFDHELFRFISQINISLNGLAFSFSDF